MRAIAVVLSVQAAFAQATIVEWTIPTRNAQPHCVVSDSKGRIWYAAIGSDQIGMFDPATEQFTELRIPTPSAQPHGIAVGPNDTIWFTEQAGNKIGRVDPTTFEIREYPLPNPNSGPHTPIHDGRGNLWFTEQNGNRIGRLNMSTGAIEEFTIPTPNSGPYGIVPDAEGNAWFCSFGGGSNRIGRVDARTGRITEYGTPTPNSGPRRPWIDSQGRVWITENRVNRIAVFDPATERFREWTSPTPNGQPYGMVVDASDNVWYNEFNGNYLVKFDPRTESFTRYPFPAPRANVRIVAIDPQNRVWYGDNRSSRLGVIVEQNSVLNAASLKPSIAPGAYVSIFGSRLATRSAEAQGLPLPAGLADVSVTFGDASAPLHFVSPQQINALVPPDAPAGSTVMQVRRGDFMTFTQEVTIQTAAPGIFTVNQNGEGPGIVVHAADFRLVTRDNPARPGEFLSIFCVGLGPLDTAVAAGSPPPSPPPATTEVPRVTLGGRDARVTFSGAAPGYAGLYQVNISVPDDVPSGDQPLQITIHGAASNTVTLTVAR